MADATAPSPDLPAGKTNILHANPDGSFSIPEMARGDIQRIDISDVDLLITSKNSDHYLIPGGGIAAMGDHPPSISFGDGIVSSSALLSEVGAALDLAITTPMPASFKIEGAKEGGVGGKEQQLAQTVHKLEQQVKEQQQQVKEQQHKIEEQQKQIDQHHKSDSQGCDADNQTQGTNGPTDCTRHKDDYQEVAPLNTNASNAIEQMVNNLQQLEDALHNKDYDYTPPAQFSQPPAPPTPPPGVPPPISLTPLVTLFMGNVAGVTTETSNGVNYFFGGGGADNSGATANIGPRDALQFSPAVITGDNSNDAIYAEGPLVGNTNPVLNNTTYYAKEFLLNVAGYFTSVNAIQISGVPAGVTIQGATSTGNGTYTLPSSYVLDQTVFTMIYNTSAYVPAGNNTFTITFEVSGTVTHGQTFTSKQNIEFEYMDVTSASQVTDPTLVYDAGGYTNEIYVLPTEDQPNVISAGDGNDTVVGSRSNDTITLGNGNDSITDGSGTDSITVGNGNDTITAGDGNDTVIAGSGVNTVTLGNGNNSVTVGSGGGTISVGTGNNSISVNSAIGTTANYSITTLGSGTDNINGGDGDYAINMGSGTNTVVLGNSTALGNGTTTFDTSIVAGNGQNTISVGNGVHSISVGTGVNSITTGTGNNKIVTQGGGGTISTGSGNQVINMTSASASKNAYSITTTGTGTTTLNAQDDNYTIIAGNSGANLLTIGNGTSNITATVGTGTDTIITGNGVMTVAAGGGTGDTITAGSIVPAAVANTFALSLGNGNSDSITSAGSIASTGTIAIGSGNADTISAGQGNYTITVGGANGTTNTLTLTSGTGDTIGAGDGNNTLYIGSHAAGTDTVTLGGGNNTVYVGTGTNSINAGAGANAINFSNISTGLTIAFGTNGTSTAFETASPGSFTDSITGFTTLYGTNSGDTITLNTGNLTVYAGTGNDSIQLGTGVDTVYAGNGNNTISGSSLTTVTGDKLFGGTGNNTFTNPNAGTTYNGTNGAALTAGVNQAYTFTNVTGANPFAGASGLPTDVITSYAAGTETVTINLPTQVNEVSYQSTNTTPLNVNLAAGVGSGSGGNAASSFYTFTPTAGFSTINAIIGNNGGDTFTPSFDDSILIGGNGGDVFQDGVTLSTQTIILVGDNQTTGGGTDVYYAGPGHDIIIASKLNGSQLAYGWNSSQANASNSAGIVVNFDSTSHTFTSSLLTGSISVNAYSGTNFGTVTATAAGSSTYGLNPGTSSLSWSTGDYYVPVIGTGTNITSLMGNNYYTNIVYAGTTNVTYYAGGSSSHGNFFFAGSGGSTYQMNGGWGAAVATSGGVNIIASHNDAYNDSAYNMYIILNQSLDTGIQESKDQAVSLSWGGTTYTGFVYGWGGNITTPVGNPLTYLTGYQYVEGYTGNDYIVGDNLGDQINAYTGSNTIILGDGTNIISVFQGSNNISSSTAVNQTIGTNTLNFDPVNNDGYSGVIANYGAQTTAADVLLNYTGSTVQTTFLSVGGDTTALFGSSALASAFQARIGTSSFLYDTVQAGIIGTINGGNYSSNTTVTPTTNSTYVYDNVYSGAKTIVGHGGNDIFIDNIGTAAETFNGSADKNNAYYLSPTQIADVTVTGGNTSVQDILRIPGSTPANLTTLVTNAAKFTGVDVVDLRTGTDGLLTSTTTVTMGAGSTSQTGAYALSETNLESLTHVTAGSSATLILKLDSGSTFTVTPVNGVTYVHTTSAYFTDIYTFTNGSTHVTLDIHYGTG